jgi:hypothetical protein
MCAVWDRRDLVAAWNVAEFAALLDALVAAGAVDGVTRRREPTVDGLKPEIYFSALQEIIGLFA